MHSPLTTIAFFFGVRFILDYLFHVRIKFPPRYDLLTVQINQRKANFNLAKPVIFSAGIICLTIGKSSYTTTEILGLFLSGLYVGDSVRVVRSHRREMLVPALAQDGMTVLYTPNGDLRYRTMPIFVSEEDKGKLEDVFLASLGAWVLLGIVKEYHGRML